MKKNKKIFLYTLIFLFICFSYCFAEDITKTTPNKPIIIEKPNKSEKFFISNTDTNRITCANDNPITIIDLTPKKERRYTTETTGSNLFLKTISTDNIDVHIFCKKNTYPVTLIPKKIKSRHIILSSYSKTETIIIKIFIFCFLACCFLAVVFFIFLIINRKFYLGITKIG